MHTLYELLGVRETASATELKLAYRRAAMRWHPDRHLGCPVEATAQFIEIRAAYEVLADVARRTEYDASLREWTAARNADICLHEARKAYAQHVREARARKASEARARRRQVCVAACCLVVACVVVFTPRSSTKIGPQRASAATAQPIASARTTPDVSLPETRPAMRRQRRVQRSQGRRLC
ncbi:hypothetical protein C9I57_21785 [Trinickia symbiotica]|uniref:J domain-containing protein n=1 Tax=Trinickia symbiotica TaxID=863227 RepID=A0A2T3XQ51_9BURK|nr:hypothetical protein C9I57_21785 [Trinickia symbiotica]